MKSIYTMARTVSVACRLLESPVDNNRAILRLEAVLAGSCRTGRPTRQCRDSNAFFCKPVPYIELGSIMLALYVLEESDYWGRCMIVAEPEGNPRRRCKLVRAMPWSGRPN